MQLKFSKSNERNYSYDLFSNTFKRFCIIKDRQAIVFLDTFFAPLSLLHSCPRNLYEVIRTLVDMGLKWVRTGISTKWALARKPSSNP